MLRKNIIIILIDNIYFIIRGDRCGWGGVIFYFYGHKKSQLSYILGSSPNNQEEALTLYVGLTLLPSDNQARLIVIGDSDLIIK